MRDIPQDIIDALDEGVLRPIIFVEILLDEVLRFTSATANYTVNGTEFLGFGNLGRVSDATENEDLDPQNIEIEVSGVNDGVLAALQGQKYLNRDVTVWWGLLDDQGNLLGNTVMVRFIGRTDEIKFDRGKTAKVKIVARDRLADWSRPRVEKNTNAEQQARFPGDKGFEYAAQVADKKIIWPRGDYYE